jgi:hypothetical protein
MSLAIPLILLFVAHLNLLPEREADEKHEPILISLFS